MDAASSAQTCPALVSPVRRYAREYPGEMRLLSPNDIGVQLVELERSSCAGSDEDAVESTDIACRPNRTFDTWKARELDDDIQR